MLIKKTKDYFQDIYTKNQKKDNPNAVNKYQKKLDHYEEKFFQHLQKKFFLKIEHYIKNLPSLQKQGATAKDLSFYLHVSLFMHKEDLPHQINIITHACANLEKQISKNTHNILSISNYYHQDPNDFKGPITDLYIDLCKILTNNYNTLTIVHVKMDLDILNEIVNIIIATAQATQLQKIKSSNLKPISPKKTFL